jgi:hypothetical protein
LGALPGSGLTASNKKPPLSDQDKVVPRDRDSDERKRTALESALKTSETVPTSQVKAAISIEGPMDALARKRGKRSRKAYLYKQARLCA